jgi:uncharacterized membrane protein
MTWVWILVGVLVLLAVIALARFYFAGGRRRAPGRELPESGQQSPPGDT